MKKRYVTYYRVSTNKQGISGLGMEAQRESVKRFLNGQEGEFLAEFAEVESGKNNHREELAKAIALCRKKNATLVIAKLDRLARNAAFLLNLRDSGIEFLAVDMPHADKFTIGVIALVAERERDMVSIRTKEGLAAAKKRGQRLGNPNPKLALKLGTKRNIDRANRYAQNVIPIINELKKSGVKSLRKIAGCLNCRGIFSPLGKAFSAQTVKNILARHKSDFNETK